MSEKKGEPHETRLATTDEHGHRVYIHPEDIKGKWKTRRTFFYWFLIILYLVLPWIYVDGKQWVLLNIPQREFTIFGEVFYGHDGPLLFFLVIGFIILMAFITSIWGRVWCGWACPQTVFIDSIFRQIERIVEGNARKRKKLDKQKMNLEKFFRRSLKWTLFLLVSLHIVHSFLGYFVGTRKLFWITMGSPAENWSLFITMLIITGIILFDFGWFKEQFCIIACPYGRFQSVSMDDNSLVVAYDYNRGEPRRDKNVPKDQEGDCINCNHCVKACPTGIDIRRGTQLECIACTMCIDACDNIMEKVKRPKGLIRYTTENELKNKPKPKIQIRSIIYLIILFAIAAGLSFSLSKRKDLSAQLLRASKTPYQVLKRESGEEHILNQYRLKITQTDPKKKDLILKLNNTQVKMTSPYNVIEMEEDNFQTPIFFEFEKEILINGKKTILLNLVDKDTNEVIKTMELDLVGPIK
jgi:cytochrome c oxidase accessory protein FixG